MKTKLILFILSCAIANAIELPPSPANYFNDYAGVVSKPVVDALNKKLVAYDKDTSTQIVVAIYPTLKTDSSMEDFCNQTFRKWGVGQKDKNNGAILFVFIKEHKTRIEVGYGLEPRLTDSRSKHILEELKPYFRKGDFDKGFTYAVEQMIAISTGDFTQTSNIKNTPNDINMSGWSVFFIILVLLIVTLIIIKIVRGSFGSDIDDSSSGGGWGGGGGSGSDGGFSGGSSGGGGASGSW